MAEIIIEGLTATVIGMGMVFGVLTILCVILSFFKYLNPPEQKKEDVQELVDEPFESEDFSETEDGIYDNSELIAVISAAVAACFGENARITAITPVAQASGTRSTYKGWTAAAIRENHRGLY